MMYSVLTNYCQAVKTYVLQVLLFVKKLFIIILLPEISLASNTQGVHKIRKCEIVKVSIFNFTEINTFVK